jgi:hypothetical protein
LFKTVAIARGVARSFSRRRLLGALAPTLVAALHIEKLREESVSEPRRRLQTVASDV